MLSLRNIFNSNKIDSYKKFNDYIDSSYTQLSEITCKNIDGLKIKVYGEDLTTFKQFYIHYDSTENRIFVDKIDFKLLYFNMDHLNIEDTNEIKIMDCVFNCKVVIMNAAEIVIENCVFMKSLMIYGQNNPIADVSISNSNINSLVLQNDKFDFSAYGSIFRIFEINNAILETSSYVYKNRIEHLETGSSQYKGKTINISQIELNNLKYKRFLKIKEVDLDWAFQKFLDDKEDDHEINDTYEFILNSTDISRYNPVKNTLIYNKNIINCKNQFQRILIKITGGFCKPSRWIMYLFFTIIGFSFIYCNCYFSISNQNRKLEFFNCLYFSVITFTTIGYGDISPTGLGKLFVCIEGLLGISIMSAFMVSLVKKYFE
ncbi:MAG TPA: potassium channel family protein [Caproicibacter sp.]|nr:potassium channel family protein [Caproicibacter sp.]